MKLSDAVMLGSTLGKLNNSSFKCCLLGCSMWALGGVNHVYIDGPNEGLFEAEIRWPWILTPQVPPRWLSHYGPQDRVAMKTIFTSMCRFILEGRATIDQAVEWIRSVEPAEEPVLELALESRLDGIVGECTATVERMGEP